MTHACVRSFSDEGSVSEMLQAPQPSCFVHYVAIFLPFLRWHVPVGLFLLSRFAVNFIFMLTGVHYLSRAEDFRTPVDSLSKTQNTLMRTLACDPVVSSILRSKPGARHQNKKY